VRASSRSGPPVAALFILLSVAVVLAVVALIRAASVSPAEQWTRAMAQDDYAEAALALEDVRGVERWLLQTERLALRHGETESLQGIGGILMPLGEGFIDVKKITWEDGYSRCLFLRQGEDNSISLVGGYFDCDTLAERVPEGGQLIPEDKPPDNPIVPGGPEPLGPPSPPSNLPPVQDAPPVR
jgi:hypothetical protein